MGTSDEVKIPLVVKFVAVSMFLPEQFSFYLLGMRLTVTRVIFLVFTPILLRELGRKVAAGRYRLVLSDLFVPMAGFWMVFGPANVVGTQDALSHGGPIALEFCIGYMVTRALLSEHGQSLCFVNLICLVIAIVALLGSLDPLAGHFFIRDLAGGLTGYRVPWADNIFRFGLLRATGTLEHSILFGIACTIGLLLAMFVPIRTRILPICACTLGVILSLSSAPLQGVLLGCILMAYNRITRSIRLRWFLLIGLAATAITMLFIVVSAPLNFVFSHLIFDPESGYYRLFTWQMAAVALAESPWFGLGFGVPEFYDIPYTIDSVWLESALTFGIPGSILIALSVIGAATLPTRGRRVCLTAAEAKLGTMLEILIFLIVLWGFTVHFWGTDWILVAVLAGLRAHLGELGRVGAQPPLPRA